MAGYTRQSTIADGNTIDASLFNNEYNQLLAAFVNTSGHKHDGTAAEGPVISVLGDSGVATPLNKILIDTANNHLEFYTDVSSAAVQQLRIQDGAIVPILDNDIDLGTGSLEFKDIHIDGTANIDTLVIGTSSGITAFLDEDDMASDSATAVASQQSIKSYIATQIATENELSELNDVNITSVANEDVLAYDSGTSKWINQSAAEAGLVTLTGSETLTNKILTSPVINTPTGDVATITGSQTLTNKILTSPVINTPTGDVATITGSQTLTNKILTSPTLTSPVLNTGISGTAFLDENDFASDSDTKVASQQSIKAYIATQVSAGDLTAIVAGTGLTGTDLSGPIPTLNAIGGNGITANANELVIDTSITVDKTTAQTLSSKTLTSPVLNGTLSGTAFLDEDTLSSDSAIAVASQQSIKAYVDAQAHSDVTASSTTTFTNKTIDADGTGNNISNIDNADIKAAAAIDATKIADGSVTSAEFQYINSLSSNAQDQIDLKAPLASPALTGNPTAPTQAAGNNSTRLATTAYVDNSTASRDQLGEMTDVTLSGLADANYFIYDNAASVWKNKAISGAFTSNNLGVTTLASGIDATKIADGTVTDTEFQYINSLSSNAQTQINTKASAGFAVAMAIAL